MHCTTSEFAAQSENRPHALAHSRYETSLFVIIFNKKPVSSSKIKILSAYKMEEGSKLTPIVAVPKFKNQKVLL